MQSFMRPRRKDTQEYGTWRTGMSNLLLLPPLLLLLLLC
jgi:hypothetical protein